ncbi:hypothetical protein [Wukongibacter sp. M2B1]|uniref:hypothetical protein n=1 Tax=Wukongibacter sp. M2B1 TaxID=3088895 RepID=UPI003D7BE0F6
MPDSDLSIIGINYREDIIIAGKEKTFEVVIDKSKLVKPNPCPIIILFKIS